MEVVSDDAQNEGANKAEPEINNAEKCSSAPPQTPRLAKSQPDPIREKKSKREERNKKEDKYLEHFMKAVNLASSPEEKIQVASQKYMQVVEDNKKMQFYVKQSDKRYALVAKEKEQLQLDYNKTILVKSKLENLCRELQKQNKAIKEESLHKIREEEERRKETQAKFQTTLSEITALLQQNNEKNAKLRDDNIGMTEKFKSVVQQYQLREQQVEKMSKQMSLEQQLADAKFQKASLEHQAEKERLLGEMEGLKVVIAHYGAKIVELQGTESGLRTQLAVYTDKYDEFQDALVKSNQVFGGFKEQMEKMSKKIKKLENESLSWKNRWETSQSALIDMCAERKFNEDRCNGVERQLQHMQSLCRTLQAERTVLLGALKEHNIERPPLPAPPAPADLPALPAPPAAPLKEPKLDSPAANREQLRESLAQLQTQLNTIKAQQKIQQEEPPKPEKTKKSKSKKSKKQTVKEVENTKESTTEGANENKAAIDKVENNIESANIESDVKLTDDKKEDLVAKAMAPEKVGDKTLESLIQAINNANITLCDLEVIGDNKIDLEDSLKDNLIKSINEVSEVESSKDETSQDSPKRIQIIELLDDNENVDMPELIDIEVSTDVKEVANIEIKSNIDVKLASVNEA